MYILISVFSDNMTLVHYRICDIYTNFCTLFTFVCSSNYLCKLTMGLIHVIHVMSSCRTRLYGVMTVILQKNDKVLVISFNKF